jgi:histidinol phosphatase-like PHP family hydrolase
VAETLTFQQGPDPWKKMPIHNNDIVKNFNKMADLLEIKGANPFRVRAYRNAARTIGSLSKSVADLIAASKPLTDFSGIGKDLAEKIKEIVKTGKLSQLQELDVVIGAIHSDFKLSHQKQTERILRAMDNPWFNILAHPSGRLINAREPYEVDLERLIEAAAERGCFMELNAHPDRLDLDDVFCKTAKDLGVKIAVSTGAHSVDSLDYMRLGVLQARRGWLEPDDVLNTRSWKALQKLLQRS